MGPVLDNLCHWTQNILLDNLLYETYFLTITKHCYGKLTVLKPHLPKVSIVYQRVTVNAHGKFFLDFCLNYKRYIS